jgi:hypothetical protein
VTGYEDNLTCVEVCNSFPKWGQCDQKRKFVFADNKIILMRGEDQVPTRLRNAEKSEPTTGAAKQVMLHLQDKAYK